MPLKLLRKFRANVFAHYVIPYFNMLLTAHRGALTWHALDDEGKICYTASWIDKGEPQVYADSFEATEEGFNEAWSRLKERVRGN